MQEKSKIPVYLFISLHMKPVLDILSSFFFINDIVHKINDLQFAASSIIWDQISL